VYHVADVFISYARPDIGHAERVAGIIERLGWSVFWDQELTTGERFASRLSDELSSAKAIVVVWSMASASSDWVKDGRGDHHPR
jgi:adenylate cyclase